MKEYDKKIAIRISAKDRKRIQRCVRKGQHSNISKLVRAAVEEFLEKKGEWSHE